MHLKLNQILGYLNIYMVGEIIPKNCDINNNVNIRSHHQVIYQYNMIYIMKKQY